MHYPNTIVLLHWLLAPFILLALFMGNDIAQLSNDLDLKVDRLTVHASAGMMMGVLFLVRFILRLRTKRAADVPESSALTQRISSGVHWAMYGLVFSVVITGVCIAFQVDMLMIIQTGDTLPETLSNLPARQLHGILTAALLALITLHIVAAFYHQFILRDRLWRRMSLRKHHQ